MTSPTIHATAVLVDGRGVLIRGASGSGKSSLALGLIYDGRSATLVADDRVALAVRDGRLTAAVPDVLAGRLEVRGVGIVRLEHQSPAGIDLVVDLLPLAECPRLPDETGRSVTIEGVALPRIFVAIGAVDGPARVWAGLAALGRKPL